MIAPVTRGPLIPRALPAPPLKPEPYTICLGCGCSSDDACLTDGVPCSWADPFHCTRCALLQRAGGAIEIPRTHDPLVAEIMKATCDQFGLERSALTSACRSRSVARPRQIAMYLARRLTRQSYPEIGRRFGGRDHATAMHAIARVEQLLEHDVEVIDDVRAVAQRTARLVAERTTARLEEIAA